MFYLATVQDKTERFPTFCASMRTVFTLSGQHVKMGVWGYSVLRPDLVGELSASMHRTDKASYDNLAFQNCIVQKVVPTSMTGLTYGSALSVSLYRPQKARCKKLTAKPLMVHHSGEEKKERTRTKKWKFSIVDKRASRRQVILTWGSDTAKRKTVEQERNPDLAAGYTSRWHTAYSVRHSQ